MTDFYEEDEDLADIVGIFDRGPKNVTAPPNVFNALWTPWGISYNGGPFIPHGES